MVHVHAKVSFSTGFLVLPHNPDNLFRVERSFCFIIRYRFLLSSSILFQINHPSGWCMQFQRSREKKLNFVLFSFVFICFFIAFLNIRVFHVALSATNSSFWGCSSIEWQCNQQMMVIKLFDRMKRMNNLHCLCFFSTFYWKKLIWFQWEKKMQTQFQFQLK